MAAFLNRFLPWALFLAPQTGILQRPRFAMLDAGSENGRLSREVTRCNRRRLFFLPSFPSPSTSDNARRRLNGRFSGAGADNGQSKDSFREDVAKKVKVKVSDEVSLLLKLCIMLTRGSVLGMASRLVVQQSPI